MSILKRWFKGLTKKPSGPRPVTHPGLLAKLNKESRPRGVGIVYGPEGQPQITMDWVRGLTYVDRVAVDAELARRGWKISGDAVERIG